MSVHSLLDEVRAALRPDADLLEHRDAVVSAINRELRKRDIHALAVAGGSVAKGTFLRGDHDIDVFVRFSLDYASEEEVLPDLLARALAPFAPDRVHGSRDYFQFSYEGYDFEVIPVLAVEDASQARNVTDMSPLHVTYFVERSQKQEDEVRLLKQFCKAAGVYGAESYIRGFSGHVIDVLILHYKDFYSAIRAIARWKPPVIIDVEGHHDDALSAIDTAKHAPLVLVDPMQPSRNAAAALSQEQFDVLVSRARAFVKDPSEEFFVVEPFHLPALRARLDEHTGAAVLVFATHENADKRDVAGAKVRKAFERIRACFVQHGFTLVEDGWYFAFRGESVCWFVTEEHSLPRLREHRGPPVHAETDAARFRAAHPDAAEREGVLFASVARSVRTPEHVVAEVKDEVHARLGVSLRVEGLGAPT